MVASSAYLLILCVFQSIANISPILINIGHIFSHSISSLLCFLFHFFLNLLFFSHLIFFVDFSSLTRDLVNVVLGQSGIQLFVQGPYEQINRVDCVHDLKTGGVMLLHLYNGVQYTRHVLPTYLPPKYVIYAFLSL